MLNIVLRTVCGCERTIAIPFNHYPPTFVVPYRRTKFAHFCPQDGESCMSMPESFSRRVFEQTSMVGVYGYRVYLEKTE